MAPVDNHGSMRGVILCLLVLLILVPGATAGHAGPVEDAIGILPTQFDVPLPVSRTLPTPCLEGEEFGVAMDGNCQTGITPVPVLLGPLYDLIVLLGPLYNQMVRSFNI